MVCNTSRSGTALCDSGSRQPAASPLPPPLSPPSSSRRMLSEAGSPPSPPYVFVAKMNYDNCKTSCESRGGRMPCIRNAEDNKALGAFVNNSLGWPTQFTDNLWIGSLHQSLRPGAPSRTPTGSQASPTTNSAHRSFARTCTQVERGMTRHAPTRGAACAT